MAKKLQPGDKFNRYQAKKVERKVVKDVVGKKYNASLIKIAKQKTSNFKRGVTGLI